MRGYSMPKCARLGCLAGGAVVQVVGAEMTPEAWRWLFARWELQLMPRAPMHCYPSLPAMLRTFTPHSLLIACRLCRTAILSAVVLKRSVMCALAGCHCLLRRRLQLHLP